MPKTSRDVRTMARTLDKQRVELVNIRREHRQAALNNELNTEMTLSIVKKLENAQREVCILRQSLKNFSKPYYRLKKVVRKQANILKAYRTGKSHRLVAI